MPVKRTCPICGVVYSVTPDKARRTPGTRTTCGGACALVQRDHAAAAWPDRFWSKVERSPDPDGCWLWTAHLVDGYGQFHRVIGGAWRHQRAHRLAWELMNGPIPDGMMVCHTCDVRYGPGDYSYRRCCNPAHLFIGTNADNMADMASKGRAASGERNALRLCPERALRGEQNARARMTDATVREARARFRAGGITKAQLARDYGVGESPMRRILNGTTWTHVT